MSNQLRIFIMAVVVYLACGAAVIAQTTAFTYQGKLTDGGTPANGNFDLQFTLWNSLTGGTQVGSTLTINTVNVSGGVFTVSLDFGASSFTGPNRFLEIGAKPAGSVSFTILSPRQQITSTPYAVRSLNATSADSVPASGVSAGSGNYIQNSTTPQSSSNFNISGNGTAGGTLSGNIVNATTQFNLGGNRILSAGAENSFLGVGAGAANAGGIENSFFGRFAGGSNTLGSGNSFFGFVSGGNTTEGSFNSIFGSGAGSRAVLGNGNFNSLFGHRAGENNDGSTNSFFGTGSGRLNFSGNSNTFIGHDAGDFNLEGSFNTVLGARADVSVESLTNAAAIGARALVSQSNSLVLGSIKGVNDATENTKVGIGTTSPAGNLHVNAQSSPDPISALTVDVESFQTPGNAIASYFFRARDIGSGSAPVFLIRGDGNVGIGTATPASRLDVSGIIRVSTLGAAGATQLCQNTSFQISSCSSSLRYKANIAPFLSGLSFIKQLQPISFSWKEGGMKDVGFGAEDVAKLNPLLVTHNAEGEVEGVKYDRLSAVFVNAFKEQQLQIERQQSEIEEQKTLLKQQHTYIQHQGTLLKQQQIQLDLIKRMICSERPNADICKGGSNNE